ncbi:hypothetical protein EHV15_17955 [Paenibacillus oralis]|uniref:Sugar ABC transporter permease n=1 Tax=Paenibacillus oralis TaxID=2490856 RepID=A0A3P3UB99_9BACL|nr:hypothetical protein EHV15_17955 [Paenibacillus oralis]
MDGASEYRIFWPIVAPLSAPIVATFGLFISIMYWNDWMNGMIYLTKPEPFSLQNLMNRILGSFYTLLRHCKIGLVIR